MVGFLAYLYYNARTIKKEKDVYLTDGIRHQLGRLSLLAPNWWTLRKLSLLQDTGESSLEFYRADTHYDWLSQFHLVQNNSAELPDLLEKILQELSIEMDQDTTRNNSFSFTDLQFQELIRIEGTATRFGEDRIYLDLVLSKLENNEILLALSLSSILNGCVEGPYFEETLKSLCLN